MKRLCVAMAWLYYLFLASSLVAQEAPGTITTVAPGSGGHGLTVDVKGNLYIGPSLEPPGWGPFWIYQSDGARTILLNGDYSTTRNFGDGQAAYRYGFVRSTHLGGTRLTPGMTVDLRGNVYIAASYDQRVRRVDPNGIIWTAAGSGVRDFTFRPGYSADFVNGGFSGDGGLATQAELNMPTDVALDAQGNLYIVDCGNNRIRMVNREGFIRTFAGNLSGASVSAGDGGPGVNASLVTPVSVAVDMKGNVYVAEFATHKIRRIAPDGQNTITTFAGTGQAGFSGDDGPAAQALLNRPMGVAVDVAGNVYIADYQNHRVRKVDIKGVITTFAGTGSGVGPSGEGGPALQARITYPRDLAVDAKGYVYISTEEQLIKTNDYNLVHRVSPVKEFEIPCIRLSDTSLHFETASINQTAVQSITVSNAGKGTPLLVEVGPDKDVPEFKVISLTNFLVQPGGLEKVTVRYTPSTLRSRSATIQIYHNGTEANPLRVSLSGSGPIRTADFNGDGMVDLDDFFLFAGAFGRDVTADSERYDLDGDYKIGFDDFFLFAARFGK